MTFVDSGGNNHICDLDVILFEVVDGKPSVQILCHRLATHFLSFPMMNNFGK